MLTPPRSAAWLLAFTAACGGSAGKEDSELLVPFADLAGGIVMATSAVQGSAGYDLWWIPFPDAPTLNAQPMVRLTDANGDQWQPSTSPGGNGIAFATNGDGIFLITTSGRIRRISDTRDTTYRDSLPAVSWEGDRVAWVREDSSQPIGDTGFDQTYIMIANADGSDIHALSPAANTIQDAPKFEPRAGGTRLVWSEFAADTLTVDGPQDYGIRLFDFITNTDRYLCRGDVQVDGYVYRCFGQHLAWTVNDAVVLPQSFLELYIDGSPATSSYVNVLESITSQSLGTPVLDGPHGFYNAFPMSVSYQYLDRMVFDGLVTSVEGDLTSLGLFVAGVDGGNIWRLNLAGLVYDYDPVSTAGFLFSVATPQVVPPAQLR
ncbi:MAG: hypothetical protein KC933_18485 [Myxococcales bacterium]|nr:hypothetical protein [Myxococcales bacterium]